MYDKDEYYDFDDSIDFIEDDIFLEFLETFENKTDLTDILWNQEA